MLNLSVNMICNIFRACPFGPIGSTPPTPSSSFPTTLLHYGERRRRNHHKNGMPKKKKKKKNGYDPASSVYKLDLINGG